VDYGKKLAKFDGAEREILTVAAGETRSRELLLAIPDVGKLEQFQALERVATALSRLRPNPVRFSVYPFSR